ncbi:MAG: MBL fold metallo-hydrolase [Paracoccaceae bacterium]
MAGCLTLLGTKGGPAVRQGGPNPTSSVLELGGKVIIVDCGLGVTRALVEAGIDLKTLGYIFITHLHSDHILELGPLLHTAWTSGLATPVQVFGPKGTRAYWQAFLASMQFDIDIRLADEGRPNLVEFVRITEHTEGPVLREPGLTVSALRVDHPPVTDCFALKFETGNKRIVFSADTAYFPPLADFASGADVLVHEAMLNEGVERLVARTGNGARLKQHLLNSHTLVEDAIKIARDAGVKHLYLHHLVPADDPEITLEYWDDYVHALWDGPVTVGRDGLKITL